MDLIESYKQKDKKDISFLYDICTYIIDNIECEFISIAYKDDITWKIHTFWDKNININPSNNDGIGWDYLSDNYESVEEPIFIFKKENINNWSILPFKHTILTNVIIYPIIVNNIVLVLGNLDLIEFKKFNCENKITDILNLICKDIINIKKINVMIDEKKNCLKSIVNRVRPDLNNILNISTTLQKTTNISNIQQNYIENLNKSTINLATTFTDIIDLSKIELNSLKLKKEIFSIKECIFDSIDILKAILYERRNEVKVDIGITVPILIYSDYGRLKQILINLIKNANYNTEYGIIYISVNAYMIFEQESTTTEIDDNRILRPRYDINFSIEDTGNGLEYKNTLELFIPITIFKESRLEEISSNTLGLTISKYLANLMEGNVWLDSTKIDQGSIFKFNIIAYEEEYISSLSNDSLKILKNKNVLIVDNCKYNRTFISNILEKWGMICVSVGNGEEASILHLNSNLNLALIQINLPNKNGIYLANFIKGLGYKMPLIAISDDDTIDIPIPFDDIIYTPTEEKNLILKISNILLFP